MGTNKERIEHLESGLGIGQDGLQRMELGVNDKLQHLEETLHRLFFFGKLTYVLKEKIQRI